MDLLYVVSELSEIAHDSLKNAELKQKLPDSKEFLKDEESASFLGSISEERVEEEQREEKGRGNGKRNRKKERSFILHNLREEKENSHLPNQLEELKNEICGLNEEKEEMHQTECENSEQDLIKEKGSNENEKLDRLEKNLRHLRRMREKEGRKE
ncbi:hypothetical protein NPIL_119631 [Nephila pilipes]|uniref:Uncharacterized protein n=1 Tax=Nephila pilipes TaxID=299642 RepID=A0A8X6P3C5_NEPPI|nr:hypothetical protein NPIL_119631 [Nephila pilipes]